jgi:ketosteroid isomerase-like protein
MSIERLKEFFSAYESGDDEALERIVDEDVTYHVPGRSRYSGHHRGRDKILAVWNEQKDVMSGRAYVTEAYDFAETDQHVIMLARAKARRDDGSSVEYREANVYRFEEGRLAECRVHIFDLHEFEAFWGV